MDLDASAAAGTLATVTTATAAYEEGFDDNLRDTKPGRYGRIVVYKSSRAELIIGKGGGEEGWIYACP